MATVTTRLALGARLLPAVNPPTGHLAIRRQAGNALLSLHFYDISNGENPSVGIGLAVHFQERRPYASGCKLPASSRGPGGG